MIEGDIVQDLHRDNMHILRYNAHT